MNILFPLIAVSLTFSVQHWLMRRKLDELNSALDSTMAELSGGDLDFFRSERMRARHHQTTRPDDRRRPSAKFCARRAR